MESPVIFVQQDRFVLLDHHNIIIAQMVPILITLAQRLVMIVGKGKCLLEMYILKHLKISRVT